MRALVMLVLVACGGAKKYAYAPSRVEPVSKLEQQAALDEPVSNAQISRSTRLDSLHSDVAVRHRRLTSWRDIIAVDSGGSSPGASVSGPSSPPPAQPLASPEQKEPEKLVVEAWLDLVADDVGQAVDTIRARVEASGGRMVSENVQGSGKAATSAALEFRVPPGSAPAITTWLGTIANVTSKRVLASDVSKQLFDQELALQNLHITMERLQKLAAQNGPVADLLAIETEMTRVRGEIEKIKGEQRWLLDRVELATITVQLTRRDAGESIYEDVPEARVYPGPQLAMLTLLDPGMRTRTRVGGGVSLRVQRYATFELDVFPRGDGGDSRAILATFGSALYSSYLRDGRRRFLNPYIGGRAGYGHLSGSGSPVIAGEIGVELFKHEYLVVDASVRMVAFVRSDAEAALNATMGLSVPF